MNFIAMTVSVLLLAAAPVLFLLGAAYGKPFESALIAACLVFVSIHMAVQVNRHP